MTNLCPQCGHPIRSASRFCPRCGLLLKEQLEPGALLGNGRYRIVRSISKGGMGAVYLAEDRGAFDRLCIAKQMLEYYDPGEPEDRLKAQQRFEDEGRTLAGLSHPGIPRIYSFLQEAGRFYIVMEYVRGENLAAFTTREGDRGPIPPIRRMPREEMVRHTIQVCRILEYLHNPQRPVVHQDIKPANIILEPESDVRLVDFGTARRRDHSQQGQPGTDDRSSIYGTAGYAPPEQYRGLPEPKSDVFALAATAYHVLTDDDPQDHPFTWPRLDTLPRELALALQRALRNKPEERSTAQELRQALEPISTPQRTLEVFTFPGNAQIRTVGALPSLADEHWDASRGFLYQGDFQRWLRDINRLDLVIAADDIVAREENRDAGLERFLHTVDPGLPDPKIVADPAEIDLGGVARVSALTVRASLTNTSRGYVLGQVQSSEPWLEVHPPQMHLWAGIPSYMRIHVRAEDLPFRAEQSGTISVADLEGQSLVSIHVKAHVSLVREMGRILWRALSAAGPLSWRYVKRTWGAHSTAFARVSRPFRKQPWLIWLLWLLVSAATGILLTFATDSAPLPWSGISPASQEWVQIVMGAILLPPLLLLILWPAVVVASVCIAGVAGALVGAFRSFVR